MKKQSYRLRLLVLLLLWPASTAMAVEVHEIPVPTANSGIRQMTLGPDGTIWFTESAARRIGRLLQSGTILEYLLPASVGSPKLIAVGADNNVWFSVLDVTEPAEQIGQLTPNGIFKFFNVQMVPTRTLLSSLTAVRGDVEIYFSANQRVLGEECALVGGIFKIVPDGTITTVRPGANARNLAVSQGNVWFSLNICEDLAPVGADLTKFSNDGVSSKLGNFSRVYSQIETAARSIWALVRARDGSLSILQPEFPENRIALPQFLELSSLIEGANCDFWFIADNSIVRAGLDGSLEQYELGLGVPTSLVKSADNNILFSTANTIYRLIPDQPGNLVITRSTSYVRGAMATDSLVTVFGNGLTTTTQGAISTPLPFELAGVKVIFTDVNGIDYPAGLVFASPTQINCLVPLNVQLGNATVKVVKTSGETVSVGKTIIDLLSPGLFTADASGGGIAAAVALRVKDDGSQVFEPVSVSNPIDLQAGGQVFLLLFGSGLRGQSDPSKVRILSTFGGSPTFVGAQGSFVGLDQVNILLPARLAGSGVIDLQLIVQGTSSDRYTNIVKIPIK